MFLVIIGFVFRKGGVFVVMTGNGDLVGKVDVMKRRE